MVPPHFPKTEGESAMKWSTWGLSVTGSVLLVLAGCKGSENYSVQGSLTATGILPQEIIATAQAAEALAVMIENVNDNKERLIAETEENLARSLAMTLENMGLPAAIERLAETDTIKIVSRD